MKSTIVALFIAAAAFAQVRTNAHPKPVNLNFEDGAVGKAPPGWMALTAGFAARTVAGGASSAKAASLETVAGTANPHPFGNLMQTIDATAYRGKWVRIRASIKVGANGTPATRAQLWFRVDRAGGRMGFFDNMMNRPVVARDWTTAEIEGDVADDAMTLNFGLLMLGGGEALIDEVSIVPGAKVETRIEPARPLDARGLANLTAFARLFGYVRHFHPSDQAAAAKWDLIAVDGVRAIEGAKNAAELAEKLDAFFKPLAPTVQVYVTGDAPAPIPAPQPLSGLQLVSWRHTGFGQKDSRSPYHSERVHKDYAPPAPPPLEFDLGGGVSARVPLAVFADASGTLPAAAAKAESAPMKFTADDRATRLADVVLLWNVLQHFYPYFDVVKTDWLAILPESLKRAATDADEVAFHRTLRTMMAALQDGHGYVAHSSDPQATLPLRFGFVENELVVTHVAGEIGVRPGDVVERIDGRPAKEVLAETEALTAAATPQYRRWQALQRLRVGKTGSEAKLDLRRGEEKRAVAVRHSEKDTVEEARPTKIAEIENGIFYVDLSRISNDDFTAMLDKLAAARGVIFDLRGYPSGSPEFLTHLTDKPLQSARWNIPIITKPDHAPVAEYDTSGRWDLQPKAPRLRGKIVFLTDGRAISYAESIMGIVEAYKLGEIVGEATAGTNGNINPVDLPGGYKVFWTGMRVIKHDGSQHHGVGIRPTVAVLPTLRGIAEKRDEQLEAAVRIAKAD